MDSFSTSFSFRKSRRLYHHIWKSSAKKQIGVCAIALLTIPLSLAPIELQRRIIDNVIELSDITLLFWLSGIYAAVVLLQQLVKYAYNYFQGRFSESVIRHMRENILDSLPPVDSSAGNEKGLSAGEADKRDDGTVVSMLTSEVEPIGQFAGNAYAQLVTEGGVLIAILGYMLYTEYWLAIVAIAAFIPQAIATPLLQNKINEQSAKRLAHIRAVGDDAIAISRGKDRQKSGILRILKMFKYRLIIYRLKFALKAFLNVCDHLADLAILAVGGYMVIVGQTNIGVVVAFLSGLSRLRTPWRTLVAYFRQVSDTQFRFDLLRRKLAPNQL